MYPSVLIAFDLVIQTYSHFTKNNLVIIPIMLF
jgi:hypothetical protein